MVLERNLPRMQSSIDINLLVVLVLRVAIKARRVRLPVRSQRRSLLVHVVVVLDIFGHELVNRRLSILWRERRVLRERKRVDGRSGGRRDRRRTARLRRASRGSNEGRSDGWLGRPAERQEWRAVLLLRRHLRHTRLGHRGWTNGTLDDSLLDRALERHLERRWGWRRIRGELLREVVVRGWRREGDGGSLRFRRLCFGLGGDVEGDSTIWSRRVWTR